MRLAILGGRGFIGRHLAAWFDARRVPDDLILACEHESLADDARLLRDFAPEVMIWAGGSRVSDPATLEEMHVVAPLANLDAARASLRRLLYLSSGEVYGPIPTPFGEEAEPRPESAYARAKQRGELRLGARAAALGIELVVVRPAVVFGPGQGLMAFIPQLIDALGRGVAFEMTGGEQSRDFLFVTDLCELLERLVDRRAPVGLYNAGSGREHTLAEVARLGAALIGADSERLLRVGALPYRAHEQMRYLLDPTRAHARLGWRARTTLEVGLRATLSAV